MDEHVKRAEQIICEAMLLNPIAIRVGFSGGNDSLAVTHWMMNNVPGCEVFHCNTGIGVEATRQFVRDTCVRQGWPLHEIRAKEDCGQDYDEIVRRFGFPGPAGHTLMYSRLKERPIRKMVRDVQKKRGERVLIATGIRHDESVRRMRYGGREVNRFGSQIWCNPIYWWTQTERDAYIDSFGLPRNPTSQLLGMSGECLCGAFAHPGELSMVKLACPETAARIERLHAEVSARGFDWGWEGRPPRAGKTAKADIVRRPLCVGCEKIHSNPDAESSSAMGANGGGETDITR